MSLPHEVVRLRVRDRLYKTCAELEPMAPYRELTNKASLSVVVLARDEEANIAACLRSIGWAGEIFVVDSGSRDRTVEIAQAFGAKVYEHSFEGYAKQRNWALRNLPISNDWVLMLDADERIPPALAGEIQQAIRNEGQNYAGFYLKFRHIFLGRFLRHGGLYPTWLLRLYKRHQVRFEDRPMNEHVILEGEAGYLSQPFDHRDLRPLRHWVSKHNRYAELEAEEYFQEKFGGGYRNSIPVRFWGSQAQRKRWIKLRVWNRLPVLFRPFLLFFRNYFLRAGFLDGQAGFVYHVLWSFWYPFLVGVKIVERRVSSEVMDLKPTCLRSLPARAGQARAVWGPVEGQGLNPAETALPPYPSPFPIGGRGCPKDGSGGT